MSRLSFDVPADSPLPVEVFDSDLQLVSRTLSSESLPVEPGTYVVEASLPDGAGARSVVRVAAEEQVAINLDLQLPYEEKPQVDYVAPVREQLRSIDLAQEELFRVGGEIWAAEVPATTPVLFGDGGDEWTRGHLQHGPGELFLPPQAGAVAVPASPELFEIVLLPRRWPSLMRVGLGPDPASGELKLEARLAHPVAHVLLGYLDSGQALNAKLMAESSELEAEALLKGKRADPLAAAAGAFALLRINALDRVHDWTRNLASWFPWLPDATVVLADHRARLGDHEAAADLLRCLPEKGVPVLSTGLDLAVERLRTYAGYWDDDRIQYALAHYTNYALASDFSSVVTTFLGFDPKRPSPLRNPHHKPGRDSR